MNERSVFLAALDIADPRERAAYLDRACGDADLRRGVEALLAADGRPGSFLRRPAAGEPTADFTPAEGPGSRVGPYKLLQQIGEGGMGVVFMAEQAEPVRRTVAVKIIKPGMDSKQVVARFEAERQALSMMDHPNIARVLDAGTTASGRPFFVMELVHGVPITKFCDDGKLTPKERLGLFVPVCQAIQHAHQKGIIHRDVKPSNILVTMYDDKPVPKVIDFGVAKAVEQRLTEKTLFTQYGALVGTFEYMSPEQAEMNAFGVDTRSDVYSLGVLLYELLTGTTPLERRRLREAALDEVIRLIKEEEPPRPSLRLSTTATLEKVAAARKTEPAKLSSLVRGELDWIVMRCLEKDRTRRYEGAAALARDVERYLGGDAVEACPPTVGYRLRKSYRRNRAAVLVTAAFVALLTVSTVTAVGLAVQAINSERAATVEQARSTEREVEANEQREQAVAARRRAEEEKRAADAVRGFLQKDLLEQASLMAQANALSPAGGDFEIKPNPTINELLDRAAAQLTPERIEAKFPNMPFVQAEVLHAVATAYAGIGQDPKAVALIERAIPLYLASRGPADRATLTARSLRGLLDLYLGQNLKGEAALAAVAADARRAFGPQDQIAFDADVWRGRSMIERGRPAEAIPFFQKLKADGTEYYGPADKLSLLAAGHLAMAYRLNMQVPQAVREMESVLALVTGSRMRPDHPLIDAGFGELAAAYVAMGRPDDALRVWREVLAPWEARNEPFHRNTWVARHEMGWITSRKGQTEEAAKLFEDNIKAADHPLKLMSSYNALQQMEQKLGRHDAALAHARQALAVLLAGEPTTFRSWYTGLARLRLGQIYLDQNNHAEAEPLLTAAFRDLADFHNQRPSYDGGGLLGTARLALARLYKATNRPGEVSRVTAEYAAVLEKQGAGLVAPPSKLAWEVFSSGDHETAAKLFELNVKAAPSPETKSGAYHGLFESEQKLGRTDAAREHARAAVDVIVSARGPGHRSYRLGMARSNLGNLLFELKDYAAAEPHLTAGCREVADHADQIPDYDYPHRHVSFDYLIALLERAGRHDEAKKWTDVKAELLEKLMRKTLAGDRLTKTTVTLAEPLVLGHVAADRPDAALALYREIAAKHEPADKAAADAWLRLSGIVFNTYEGKLQYERIKPWAELRIPTLERQFETVRAAKPSELRLLQATNTLAFSYVHAGRHADVVKLVEESLGRNTANGWRDAASAVPAFASQVKVVTLAGRPDLGTEVATAVLAALRKMPKPKPDALAAATFSLGFARSHAGAHAEAEGHFRDALRLQAEADAKHWTAAKYKAWLGFALHDRTKHDAAEPVLLEAHAELVGRLADLPLWEKQHPLLVADRLASLYEATGRPGKAAEWLGRRGDR